MAGEPTFFEIGVADAERGRAFYGALFGWTFDPGPSGGGGLAITTGGVPGGLHGGDAGASPYLFFRVDDLDAAAARVRDLGGTVDDMGEEGAESEESAARFGRFTLCRDDQGSVFGLHEPPQGA
ncbi:VOC family protein [Streptomyces sporangiiformans]|uniref:VOC family protein n=1 Tax=Streptomyces sporangiiformans TaxID=2315329 RepID=A0A505DPT3_9ACTN|nr:VOC family protein [Streptomyces sporangiiformans]TPQ23190.1 VOC family protein [Streptomyces sporangiiformans]